MRKIPKNLFKKIELYHELKFSNNIKKDIFLLCEKKQKIDFCKNWNYVVELNKEFSFSKKQELIFED